MVGSAASALVAGACRMAICPQYYGILPGEPNDASKPKCVLKLRRYAVESIVKRSIEILEPATVDHDEQIVARFENPPEAALKAEDARFVVVLLQVLPGDVRREVVVGAGRPHLGVEPALDKADVVPISTQCDGQMRVWFERQTQAGLLACPVVEAAPPVREIDDPSAFGGRVHFGPESVPLIRACRQDDARGNFEWRVEVLELRNDVPFEVFAGLGSDVERCHEHTPVLETVAQVRDVFRLELEEELPDAPALRPRLERKARVRRPDSGTRHETECRLKVVADLRPVQEQIPAIVRVRNSESAGVVLAEHLIVGSLGEEIERDVLVAVELRRREPGVDAEQVVGSRAFRVAVRRDRTDPGLLEQIPADAAGEQILSLQAAIRKIACLDVENADVVV